MRNDILAIVKKRQPITRGEIAHHLGCKQSDVYRAINDMIEDGLIIEQCETRWGELLMPEFEGYEIEMPDQYIRVKNEKSMASKF